jgi:hypothetical protein
MRAVFPVQTRLEDFARQELYGTNLCARFLVPPTLYGVTHRGFWWKQGTRVCITPGSKDVKAVYGNFAWKTYGECHADILALGSAIVGLDLAPESEDPTPVR